MTEAAIEPSRSSILGPARPLSTRFLRRTAEWPEHTAWPTDPDGNVWADNQATGDLLMFDVKTQQFKDFTRPAGTPTRWGHHRDGQQGQQRNDLGYFARRSDKA